MSGRYNFTPYTGDSPNPLSMQPSYQKLLQVMTKAKEKNVSEEITKELDNVIGMLECRELYTDKHCSNESDTLREIRIKTIDTDWAKVKEAGDVKINMTPRMMTGKIEGEFLKFLVSMQRAKRVLDIGMFTGYSALAMAEAIPPDGVVITCDFEEYLQEIARKKFDESPHGAKIDIRIGYAKDTMMSLADEGHRFDLIFIDADKDNIQNYYNIVMDQGLLAPHGTIVVDNAFRGGRSYLSDGDPMDAFNKQVEKDPRVRRVSVNVNNHPRNPGHLNSHSIDTMPWEQDSDFPR